MLRWRTGVGASSPPGGVTCHAECTMGDECESRDPESGDLLRICGLTSVVVNQLTFLRFNCGVRTLRGLVATLGTVLMWGRSGLSIGGACLALLQGCQKKRPAHRVNRALLKKQVVCELALAGPSTKLRLSDDAASPKSSRSNRRGARSWKARGRLGRSNSQHRHYPS